MVLSLAILTVVPPSSLIVSPDKNLPDNVVTNKIFPVLYTPEAVPSTTPYAPLSTPKTYLPSSNALSSISLLGVFSKISLVKNWGSK